MTGSVRTAVAERRGDKPAPAAEGTGAVLALREEQEWWTPRQLAALKSLGIKNASNEDLLVYLHYCAKTKLDPFSKQVYLLERRSKNKQTDQWEYTQTIQVGIDGYRVIAQRAARREGVYIDYEDTIWFDAAEKKHGIWLRDEPPAGALVVVVKTLPDGTKLRYPGIAKFESYAAYGHSQKTGEKWLQSQWGVMPDHMIEKCAEAFALRRAFPNDLGGMYIEEELQHMQHEPPPKLAARKREPASGEEWVIPGEVSFTGSPAGTGQPRGESGTDQPGDDDDTPVSDEVRDRQQATVRMTAIFREHGLSGRDWADARRAVVSGLLAGEDGTEYVKLTDLATPALVAATAALEKFCDETEATGADVHAALAAYADAVIERWKPQ